MKNFLIIFFCAFSVIVNAQITGGSKIQTTTASGIVTVTMDSVSAYTASNLGGKLGISNDTTFFFGDSYTYGVGATVTQNRFATLVSKLLRTSESNYGYSGMTMGAGANSMQNQLNYIPYFTANTSKYVVFAFGTNDIGLGGNVGYDTVAFKAGYRNALNTAISRGWSTNKIVIVKPAYITFNGLQGYGGATNKTDLKSQSYQNAIDSLTKETNYVGINKVNLYTPTKNSDTLGLYAPDYLHPSDLGHKFIAELIYSSLKDSVKSNSTSLVKINSGADIQAPKFRNLPYLDNSYSLGIDSFGIVGLKNPTNPYYYGGRIQINNVVDDGTKANLQVNGNASVNGSLKVNGDVTGIANNFSQNSFISNSVYPPTNFSGAGLHLFTYSNNSYILSKDYTTGLTKNLYLNFSGTGSQGIVGVGNNADDGSGSVFQVQGNSSMHGSLKVNGDITGIANNFSQNSFISNSVYPPTGFSGAGLHLFTFSNNSYILSKDYTTGLTKNLYLNFSGTGSQGIVGVGNNADDGSGSVFQVQGGASVSGTLKVASVNVSGNMIAAQINSLTFGLGGSNVSTNLAIGVTSLNSNTTGNQNTSIGYQSSYFNTTGSSNTSLGSYAGLFNLSGSNNTFVGVGAGQYSLGNQNICIGSSAGYNSKSNQNIFIGYSAANSIISGSSNTYLGVQSTGVTNEASRSNMLVLGTQSNGVYIFGDSTGAIGIGTTTPAYKLDVNATANPLRLTGLQAGASTDLIVTSASGVLRTQTAAQIIANGITKTSVTSTFTVPASGEYLIPFTLTGTTNTSIVAASYIATDVTGCSFSIPYLAGDGTGTVKVTNRTTSAVTFTSLKVNFAVVSY